MATELSSGRNRLAEFFEGCKGNFFAILIVALLSEQRAEVVVMPVREGEMSRPGSDMPSIPMSP